MDISSRRLNSIVLTVQVEHEFSSAIVTHILQTISSFWCCCHVYRSHCHTVSLSELYWWSNSKLSLVCLQTGKFWTPLFPQTSSATDWHLSLFCVAAKSWRNNCIVFHFTWTNNINILCSKKICIKLLGVCWLLEKETASYDSSVSSVG